MLRFYFPLILTTMAVVLSQYLQKMVPRQVHPLSALIVIYGMAFLISLTAFVATSGRTALMPSLREVSWVSYAMGGVILGFESGSILAYRAQWKISTFGLFVNATSALVLLPMGIWLFRERFTPMNWAGVALCLAGLALLTNK